MLLIRKVKTNTIGKNATSATMRNVRTSWIPSKNGKAIDIEN